MVSEEEGTMAVAIARRVLDRALDRPYSEDLLTSEFRRKLPPVFSEKRGLFVTLLTHPGRDLRGCIGFPLPVYPLGEGVARAAWLAAREDPRFLPVGPEEARQILAEVSVLTPLERLRNTNPEEVLGEVVVGRDGLYIARDLDSGLLLPEVPVEQGWSAEEFLEGVCMKAGLPAGAWKRKGTSLWKFRSEIFIEASPGGPVRPRSLTPVPG